MTHFYRAQCDSHDWEGMAQTNREDAQKDLDAHMQQVVGVHKGARVIQTEN
jgi:hypothetical protein